jgi:hypothetical protein
MTHLESQMLALVKTMYKTIRYYKNGLFGAQPVLVTCFLRRRQGVIVVTCCTEFIERA